MNYAAPRLFSSHFFVLGNGWPGSQGSRGRGARVRCGRILLITFLPYNRGNEWH